MTPQLTYTNSRSRFADTREGSFFKAAFITYVSVQFSPVSSDLFLMSIGVLYAKLGMKEKGIKYLTIAAQISPGNTRIKNNLSSVQQMK